MPKCQRLQRTVAHAVGHVDALFQESTVVRVAIDGCQSASPVERQRPRARWCCRRMLQRMPQPRPPFATWAVQMPEAAQRRREPELLLPASLTATPLECCPEVVVLERQLAQGADLFCADQPRRCLLSKVDRPPQMTLADVL